MAPDGNLPGQGGYEWLQSERDKAPVVIHRDTGRQLRIDYLFKEDKVNLFPNIFKKIITKDISRLTACLCCQSEDFLKCSLVFLYTFFLYIFNRPGVAGAVL